MSPETLQRISDETDVNFAPYYDLIPNLCVQRGYTRGIEIGVYTGGHAYSMLTKCSLSLLIGIDPYLYYENGMPDFENQYDYDQLKEFAIKRLSAFRFQLMNCTSDEAFKKLDDNKGLLDFVFIDGLHTYEQVKKDMENYCQLIRKGGIVSGHDIDHGSFPGVTTAIEEFAAKHGKEIVRGPFHSWYINW